MQLKHSLHLAYCTNIHRGETWPETFLSLQHQTLAVRAKVCPQKPFAIGLRLSARAASELSCPPALLEFQRWLDKNSCYVFTINGFPHGQFHGARVKENVYRPDWTSPERVDYTNRLFDLLAELLPPGIEGSVSTLPGSFKEFGLNAAALDTVRKNIWLSVEHIARLSAATSRQLHLGLEPEPLCLLENGEETIHFFDQLRADHPNDERLARHLGVNYDTCHFAVEFEDPQTALAAFVNHGIKISKIHLSSALKTPSTPEALAALKRFTDDTYLHQVIVRDETGRKVSFRDLPDALSHHASLSRRSAAKGERITQLAASKCNEDGSRITHHAPEWRIHFHVPLHAPAAPPFANTNDHLLGTLDVLAQNPRLCSHLEMETYTWEVLPPELKSHNVVDQLAAEYDWTLARLHERGLA